LVDGRWSGEINEDGEEESDEPWWAVDLQYPGSNVHERKIIGESIPKYDNTENKPFQIKKIG
jgi:hypothetical protein